MALAGALSLVKVCSSAMVIITNCVELVESMDLGMMMSVNLLVGKQTKSTLNNGEDVLFFFCLFERQVFKANGIAVLLAFSICSMFVPYTLSKFAKSHRR